MIRPLVLVAALAVAVPSALSPAAALPAGVGAPGGDAGACTGAQGPAIRADIVGLKDRRGDVKLELYPATEADFLKEDRQLIAESKVFRRVREATPASGAVSLCIRAPHPGRYALLFTHNRDGKNKFNIWSDGAGFASNQKLGRSRPKVGQAVVDVGNTVTVVTIKAQYLHGLGGFSPTG